MATDPASQMDVTAIVVSYNSEDRIAEAIRSHQEAMAHLDGEVIVVDNASEDDSVGEARRALYRGRVIANEENVGYGKAANQAISEARGRACLILNDDARLDAAAIDRMLDVLFGDDSIALVGPRIVNEQGHPMPSARLNFPGMGEEWDRIKAILKGENRNTIYPAEESPTDVAWLVAACVMGKTSVLRETGGFNPAFFLYAEDIDLARRLHDEGYRVVTIPDAVCIHTGSVSTGSAYGRAKSIERRAAARGIYYRIWEPRLLRSLVHLRRAAGISNQPTRLLHHVGKVFWDGPSLHHLQRIDPLPHRANLADDHDE